MRTTAIALLALLAMPAAAGAAPWSAPRAVTASGLAREPAVALGGPDAAAVAYVRHLSGADRVELRRGTVDRLGTPTILDRDTRHGLDSPTLTYAGHDALLVWRRFRDANTRVLELASVTRAGTVGGPRAITGPPNSFEPAFSSPDVLTFWRRQAAYTIAIANRTAGAKTRLPDGAAFESVVAKLADGTAHRRLAERRRDLRGHPRAGSHRLRRRGAPLGAGRLRALAAARRHARRPRGRRLDAVRRHGARPRHGGAPAGRRLRGADDGGCRRASRSSRVRALGISAGEVLVAFVSARADIGSGPLRALRLGPTGLAVSSVRTLTPPGERTRDVSLAADGSAGWAAWATGGTTSRHAIRVVRISRTILGTVRTVSGSDAAVPARPAFAMTAQSRALIAYATTSGRIRLVTKRAGL